VSRRVLITGGAGFIGRATTRQLVPRGWDVTLLDLLDPQVHGSVSPEVPDGARLIRGDVRDLDVLAPLVREADAVLHLAARTGVGQSMYAVRDYVDTNCLGTAALLEVLASGGNEVRKLVVASSRAVYGEGAFACCECGPVSPRFRVREQLEAGDWEARCPICGRSAAHVPTREDKPQMPGSIYAVTKRDQEEACLCIGEAYGIATVALRYFNVYGLGQAPNNPYTGLIPALASRVLTGAGADVYEDGAPLRDFVHVEDVATANVLALESDEASGALNIGSGQPVSNMQAAEVVTGVLGGPEPPRVSGRFRVGDVRHCYADTTLARERLGFTAAISFEQGVRAMADWLREQHQGDPGERAARELQQHGLLGQAAAR
jgi:dTDP-L-rhamnose 4-epimerase